MAESGEKGWEWEEGGCDGEEHPVKVVFFDSGSSVEVDQSHTSQQ